LAGAGKQVEPKKKSRRFYLVLVAAVLLIAVIVGVVIFEFFNIGNIRDGPGPVYIDEVTTDKPYYLQGEEVNFTVTVNNPQDWPVRYPGFVGYVIEKDGLIIEESGLNIDYAMPIPTFPAHSRTLYSPNLLWNQKTGPGNNRTQVPLGNYTLTVSLSGPSYDDSGNCTFEIRPAP
jgi:hypothetical protein